MLNEKEKLFVDYWEINRVKEKKIGFMLLAGLPIGLLFTVPIFFILFSSRFWFKRADMVANSQLSPTILIIAGLLIAGFVAVFYKRHQWEMKEQQFRELKAKDEASKPS